MKVLKGSIRRWGLTIDRISRGGINGGITPVSSLSKHPVGPPTLNTPPKTIHSSGMVELRIDGKMRKKECFFTKRNIGPNGVYYQAVTEWGFTIYALPSSMELIGCPTICDEDLRQIQSKAPHRYKKAGFIAAAGTGSEATYLCCGQKPPFMHQLYYLLHRPAPPSG